jgi:hypothetical protein
LPEREFNKTLESLHKIVSIIRPSSVAIKLHKEIWGGKGYDEDFYQKLVEIFGQLNGKLYKYGVLLNARFSAKFYLYFYQVSPGALLVE